MALAGLGTLALLATSDPRNNDIFSSSRGLFGVFLIGAIASTWTANILRSRRRQR
jgi:hypothetical protein